MNYMKTEDESSSGVSGTQRGPCYQHLVSHKPPSGLRHRQCRQVESTEGSVQSGHGSFGVFLSRSRL